MTANVVHRRQRVNRHPARGIGRSVVFGVGGVFRSGAPRSMKMGTTRSPWRYDSAAAQAIRPDNLRRTALLRYAAWGAVFPIWQVLRLPFDSDPFDQSRERRDVPTREII